MIKPNILLIVMDCTRPDHMGLYGYGRDTTPVIDRLADSGLTFDNAISAAVWTLESVASLYTGLFPTQHGVNIEHPLLSPRATTLASILQELGYETVAFTPGSWHGRNFGFNQGFDHFKETYRRFTHLDQLFRSETLPEKAWRHLGFRFDKNARAMNQAAMNWLSRRSSEKPFFLLIHYIEPHLPYHIPEPFRKMFLSNDITWEEVKQVNQDAYKYMAHEVDMNFQDFGVLNSLYDSSLRYMDSRIGELINHLEEFNLMESTLSILLADHGENLGEHGLMDHQYSVHETLVHVPMIMRLPGTVPSGVRDSNLVQNTDILPTVIELANESQRQFSELRGRSLLGSNVGHEFTISEYLTPVFNRFQFAHPSFDYSKYDRQLRAIRTNKFKLIWSSDGNHELFQVDIDPQEERNLVETHPDVTKELLQKLEEWLLSATEVDSVSTSVEIDPATEQRLRDLGYL